MSRLIDVLKRFNRKERFFLIGEALDNRDFTLGNAFRSRLSTTIGIPIPPDAFAAMDYHLDWIAAALSLHQNPSRQVFPNPDKVIKGTQEDIDFLVAFEAAGISHLVFLEAKGYTGWDTKQMQSKTTRMRQLFGDNGTRYSDVRPHFCLTSSFQPKLRTAVWPKWMIGNSGFSWMELSLPDDRLIVTRSDSNGNPSAVGQHFHIGPDGSNPQSGAGSAQDRRYDRDNPDRVTLAGNKDRRYRANR